MDDGRFEREVEVLDGGGSLQGDVEADSPRECAGLAVGAARAVKVVGQGPVGNVVVYQEKTARIAAVTMEAYEVGVAQRGEDEDLVAEGLRRRGGRVVAVKLFHSGDAAIVEVGEVNGSKPTVANLAAGVEAIGGGTELLIGVDRLLDAMPQEEIGHGVGTMVAPTTAAAERDCGCP